MLENEIKVHSKKISLILLAFAGFFGIANILVWYLPRRFQLDLGRLPELLNLDTEQSLPTLFSILLFLICSILFFYVYSVTKRETKKFVFEWLFLGLGFLYFACDDFLILHEKMTKPTNVFLREVGLGGILGFSWVIPAAILVLIIGLFFLKFLSHLPKKTRLLFIIAAAVFLAGAIGMETVATFVVRSFGRYSREYILEVTIEEFLEMTGPIVLIYALMDYIATFMSSVKVTFQSE